MKRSFLWLSLQVLARILTKLLFDLKVYGLENVPQTGGVLLASNHQSNLDPVLIAVRLKRPVSFLAKSELFENRWFGWFIRVLHAFPIRQGEGDIAAIRETVKRLGEGYAMNVYPEGHRTEDGEIRPLQRGIGLVLKKADVPVIPIAIDGSFQAWTKGNKIFRPHKIRVMFGKPLYFKGMQADAILEALHSSMVSLLKELREKKPLDG
jgi:1-acyl-sn-glycerol-3-phosphate acyltransferase